MRRKKRPRRKKTYRFKKGNFEQLKEIFEILHGPDGCPWDRNQTFITLIPHLKEESRELIAAVRSAKVGHIKEELGDLLLQVMFYSQIASKQNKFDIEDVISCLIKKLIRRHPHVFADIKVRSAKEAVLTWNMSKAKEKND